MILCGPHRRYELSYIITCVIHIFAKWKQLRMTVTKCIGYLGGSQNPPILKPFWTYGVQLYGTASTSNREILERFQSKVLRTILEAPRYMPSPVIRRKVQLPTAKEEICHSSSEYGDRLSVHSDNLVVNLMVQPDKKRLQRHISNDLPTD
jgi:hypothetical protein